MGVQRLQDVFLFVSKNIILVIMYCHRITVKKTFLDLDHCDCGLGWVVSEKVKNNNKTANLTHKTLKNSCECGKDIDICSVSGSWRTVPQLMTAWTWIAQRAMIVVSRKLTWSDVATVVYEEMMCNILPLRINTSLCLQTPLLNQSTPRSQYSLLVQHFVNILMCAN